MVVQLLQADPNLLESIYLLKYQRKREKGRCTDLGSGDFFPTNLLTDRVDSFILFLDITVSALSAIPCIPIWSLQATVNLKLLAYKQYRHETAKETVCT